MTAGRLVGSMPFVAASAALLFGCASLRVPVVASGHPACAQGEAEVAPIPSILDVARADRRDPASSSATHLHPDLPMHGDDNDGGGHDVH